MSTKRAAEGQPTSASPSPPKKSREDEKVAAAKAIAATFTDVCEGDLGKRAYLNCTYVWMFADDMDATIEFYTKILGFVVIFQHTNLWVELLGPGDLVLGFQPAGASTNVESAKAKEKSGITISIGTNDHEASAAELAKRGLVVDAPLVMGPVLLRNFKDPNGYQCNLVGPAPKSGADESKASDGDDAWVTEPYALEPELHFSAYSNIKLSVTSLEAAEAFWVGKLGFKKLTQFGDTWMEVQAPGKLTLGFLVEETVAPSTGWFIATGSDNMLKSRNAAAKHGVKFSQPCKEGGDFMNAVHATDPDGHPFSLVAMPEHEGDLTEPHTDFLDMGALRKACMEPYGPPELKLQNFTRLWLEVADFDATAKFYVRQLGWKLVMRMGNKWMEVAAPQGVNISFHPLSDTPRSKDQGFSIGIGTADLDKTMATLKARGVDSFCGDAEDKGMVKLQALTDPDGHTITLIGAGSAMAAAPSGDESKKEEASDAKTAGSDDGAFEMPLWSGVDPELAYSDYANITLRSTNLDATQAWWIEKMAATVAARYGNMWMELKICGGARLGFEQLESSAGCSKANYEVGVGTSDIEATRAELTKRGVTITDEVREVMRTKLLRLTDNEGNRIMLMGMGH